MGVSTTQTVEDTRLDDRTRRFDAIADRVVPYFGLVLGTIISPAVFPTDARYWLVTGPLVAGSAAWSWWFTRPRPAKAAPGMANAGTRRATPVLALHHDGSLASRHGGIYMAGLLVFMAFLVHASPFFGFQAFAGYVHSIGYLRRFWPIAGLVGSAVLASYAQLGGSLNPLTVAKLGGLAALTLVNSLVGGGFTYFGMMTSEQSERRRRIIAELNEANRRLGESLAENAELHAQLMEQAREAGVLDERARLAREIHDTIAQGLTGVVTQLEAAGAADGDPDLRRRHIDKASSLAREGLAEARRSVQALAPGPLVDARLPDVLAETAAAWAETAGVAVHVDTTGDVRPLLPDLEVALFRVAQEALTNVGKHAGAANVWLTLTYMEDVVALDVRDDGAGFDPAAVPRPSAGSGYGLATMEQRVRRVSGTFTVESAPGEGTAVSANVPAIPAAAAERADARRMTADRTDSDGTGSVRTGSVSTAGTDERGTA